MGYMVVVVFWVSLHRRVVSIQIVCYFRSMTSLRRAMMVDVISLHHLSFKDFLREGRTVINRK